MSGSEINRDKHSKKSPHVSAKASDLSSCTEFGVVEELFWIIIGMSRKVQHALYSTPKMPLSRKMAALLLMLVIFWIKYLIP